MIISFSQRNLCKNKDSQVPKLHCFFKGFLPIDLKYVVQLFDHLGIICASNLTDWDPKMSPKCTLSAPCQETKLPKNESPELARTSGRPFVASFFNIFSTSIWASIVALIVTDFEPKVVP